MPLRPLSTELAEKARLELNEDPNRINDDLQHMKDWISKQPHLRARTGKYYLELSCPFYLLLLRLLTMH